MHQQDWFLLRPLSLACRWLSSTCIFTWSAVCLSVFLNKVLLEHSHTTHLFTYCLWLLLCNNSRAGELPQRPYGPQSLKHLLSGSFTDKACWLLVYIAMRLSKIQSHTQCLIRDAVFPYSLALSMKNLIGVHFIGWGLKFHSSEKPK